ncbi:MAG: TlpA disulfide reductase family protein [Gammaproteobacteria bacterium]|jgi:thiol-disulfide isomerase/thioredoxin|nr:TlpA disulfide reductase family protein [Gammaproteobacteria bacterium]
MRAWSGAVACALLVAGMPAAAAELITPLDAAGLRNELDAARGNVVVLNFWATWCRPCLEEIPLLQDVADEFAADDFRLVSVSLDEAESMESQVIPFMQKWFPQFASYQSIEYQMDTMVSAVDPNWNEVLPTTYVLARDGSIAETIQGKFTRQQLATTITALLAAD